MPEMGGFFPRRDLPYWERPSSHTAPCCPFAVTSSREDSTYSRQDLSQALCQPRFSDLISNVSSPINWSNPFLNPFILLPLQKVAPNSLLQGVDSKFMDNSFEQRLFSSLKEAVSPLRRNCFLLLTSTLPFSESVWFHCYNFWHEGTETISNTKTLGAQH